jgi:hypothetical protein
MISCGWIISHRCSWIMVYVLCCIAQVNLIVIFMTCTCIVMYSLMLLMRIVWSFVWRKFSSVGKWEWWDEMKNGQKIKLGMPMSSQEISKRYKRQSLGMPQVIPFFINKNIRTSFKTLYFYCFICYVFFLECLYFLLSVLFCFVCCNKWLAPTYFFWRRHTPFSLPRTV